MATQEPHPTTQSSRPRHPSCLRFWSFSAPQTPSFSSYIFAKPSGVPAICHETSMPREPLPPWQGAQNKRHRGHTWSNPAMSNQTPTEPQMTHRPMGKISLVWTTAIWELFVVTRKAATKKKELRNIKFISLHIHKIYLQDDTRI